MWADTRKRVCPLLMPAQRASAMRRMERREQGRPLPSKNDDGRGVAGHTRDQVCGRRTGREGAPRTVFFFFELNMS